MAAASGFLSCLPHASDERRRLIDEDVCYAEYRTSSDFDKQYADLKSAVAAIMNEEDFSVLMGENGCSLLSSDDALDELTLSGDYSLATVLGTAVAAIVNEDDLEVLMGENTCSLFSSQDLLDEPMSSSSQSEYTLTVLCQLNENGEILSVTDPETGETKTYNRLPDSEGQHTYQASHSELAENCVELADGCNQAFVSLRSLSTSLAPNVNIENMENGLLCSFIKNPIFKSDGKLDELTKLTIARFPLTVLDDNYRKPCNCTKSQCLKLYCDCFANGDFCSDCNCNNCFNNAEHELDRFRAVKTCLDRNPEAFLPKIGKAKHGYITPRHSRGCNCKRSGCRKRYCECYEANIACTSTCKCSGCKNYMENPVHNTFKAVAQYADIGSIINICRSMEVIQATCSCLLARAEEAEIEECSPCVAEQMIVEEFGRCLAQIIFPNNQEDAF
uniref:Testis expressed metallothionein like protein n=1 Tax=Leptobrachium leishanense TaxID=445787 RepID=A0A8C5R0Z5_9ANUR